MAANNEEWLMYGKLTNGGRKFGVWMTAAMLGLGAALAVAQEQRAPDDALSGWLGREFTVQTSPLNDHMPTGGKLTFVFDADENVVRVCTRSTDKQINPWTMDFAAPCGVTMTFTKGTRYCTIDDVKTGNAEVLSSCHRLRSHDIAMHPAKVKGTVELNDMVAFLVKGENEKPGMSILVDSPARLTDGGTTIIIF
jgi:hypothetical protein